LLAEVLRSDLDVFVFLGSPYHISTWIGAALARLKGKKVYYWMHGIYRDKLGLADYLKLHAFYKLANGCLLYGNRAADILRERYKQGNYKIHVIYNSLDYRQSLAMRRIVAEREILEFRDFYFKDAALPIITFIGRLTLAKRIDLLIDAQHLLKERFGQTRFNILIIGAGSEMDNLVARSSFHGLSDNIKFLGAIYDEAEIAGILMHSDICVTPGEVGLTAIHSLSYGTPVISHNNFNIQMPEVEAIKPGINGDLYEWKNGSAMAAKISAWLEKYPIKSKETFEKCYAVIDNYYNPMYQVKIMNDAFRD
jgi:glycosyltransferase involved in cell wall biosynthesis